MNIQSADKRGESPDPETQQDVGSHKIILPGRSLNPQNLLRFAEDAHPREAFVAFRSLGYRLNDGLGPGHWILDNLTPPTKAGLTDASVWQRCWPPIRAEMKCWTM